MDVIESAQTKWAGPHHVRAQHRRKTVMFPVVFETKRSNELGTCPMRHLDECIDSFGDATISSTLDTNIEYWKVGVASKYCDKSAFSTHNGQFCYIIKCCSGLKVEPSTLQGEKDIIISLVKWKFALVYLGFVSILSRSPDEHIHHE